MKKYLMLVVMLLFTAIMFAFGQDSAVLADNAKLSFNWVSLVLDNWEYISPIVIYVVYRLVPTRQADIIKKAIDWIWGLVPDRKKGGGRH